jgi:cation transport regulator ChaB
MSMPMSKRSDFSDIDWNSWTRETEQDLIKNLYLFAGRVYKNNEERKSDIEIEI